MIDRKSYSDQEIFAESALKIISAAIESFGFKLHRKEVKTYSTTIVWRNNNQYVKVNSTTYPPDDYFSYNIILGEGDSDDFFEYDWNSVAIWALAEVMDPKTTVSSYDFPCDDDVELSIYTAKRHLLLYGETFLRGDLAIFRTARKRVNQVRIPYKIHKIDENGVFLTEDEPFSVEQKKKYS